MVRNLIPLLMLLAGAVPAFAASSAAVALETPVAGMDQCLTREFENAEFDLAQAIGVSVAVLPLDADWSWAGARGVAERESNQPLVPDHGFRIASNTKTYTAAAVLQLIAQQRLGLDDPIAEHLPVEHVRILQQGEYDPQAIRIRHLLNHSAGLREHVSEDWLWQHHAEPTRVWTPTEQLQLAMLAGPPWAAPGVEFHYSDTGYVLLGTIIERLTGQSLPVALRSLQQWDRHGLRQTWFETLEPAQGSQAHQHWKGVSTRPWHPSFDLYGGGGIVATPSDMARFTRLLLSGDLLPQPQWLEFMQATGVPAAWNDYGAGLYRLQVGEQRWLGHAGFWNTFSFYSPEDRVVFAGAVAEKTALPYAQVLQTMQRWLHRCQAAEKA